MKTITFEGQTFEYDEAAPRKWSVQKGLALGQSDPAGFYAALDRIFDGRSDEYAERLGDESDKMLGLLELISKAEGATAKN